MCHRTIRNIAVLFAFPLVSAIFAIAQSTAEPEVVTIPARNTLPWELARQVGSSRRKLFVVTLDQPHRRQACRVQSFTLDKLVCSRAVGRPRTYLPQQIVALLLPGDDDLRRRVLIGLNVGIAAAIWGTVVLAPACPACAVGQAS